MTAETTLTSSTSEHEREALECIAQLAAMGDMYKRRDRALAAMHLLDGLSQAEVGRRTGLSEGTVRIAVKVHGAELRSAAAQLQESA